MFWYRSLIRSDSSCRTVNEAVMTRTSDGCYISRRINLSYREIVSVSDVHVSVCVPCCFYGRAELGACSISVYVSMTSVAGISAYVATIPTANDVVLSVRYVEGSGWGWRGLFSENTGHDPKFG